MVYGQQSGFVVKYRSLYKKIKNLAVHSDFRKNITCYIDEAVKKEQLLQFSYPKKDIALITIKTFSYSSLTESRENFGAFLDSVFNDIRSKKISKLIIDLRSNGGGRDVYGSYLYSFLTDKSFRYYLKLETSDRELTAVEHPNLSIQKPVENPYKGKIFVLINGLSFSTTSEFCSIVRINKRGEFIGEETGGAYYGNTSGDFKDTVLPNTQITVSLPTTKYSMAVKNVTDNDRGIIPDYIVIPTIIDIINNKDVQLNYAIKLATNE